MIDRNDRRFDCEEVQTCDKGGGEYIKVDRIQTTTTSDVNKQNNQYLRRRCCLIGSFLSVAVCLFGLMRL
jgi:hypothetical protein